MKINILNNYLNQKFKGFLFGLPVFLIILVLLGCMGYGEFDHNWITKSLDYELHVLNSKKHKFNVLNAYGLLYLGSVFIFDRFKQLSNVLVKCFFMILKALAVVLPLALLGVFLHRPETSKWKVIWFGIVYLPIVSVLYLLYPKVSKIKESDLILTKRAEEMIRYTPFWVYGLVYWGTLIWMGYRGLGLWKDNDFTTLVFSLQVLRFYKTTFDTWSVFIFSCVGLVTWFDRIRKAFNTFLEYFVKGLKIYALAFLISLGALLYFCPDLIPKWFIINCGVMCLLIIVLLLLYAFSSSV